MAMPINELAVDSGYKVFYDPKFRNVLETHMEILRTHPETMLVSIGNHDAYKYEYDLFGLLQKLGYPESFHWIVMRTNDLVDPRDYRSTMTTLLIPSASVVEQVRRLFMTKYEKI